MPADHIDPLAALVVANVLAVRKRRGWTVNRLVAELPASLGWTRNQLANLEAGRREHVSVDELAALAGALGVSDPWALTLPIVPPCERCGGAPPAGFRCLDCGAPDAEVPP